MQGPLEVKNGENYLLPNYLITSIHTDFEPKKMRIKFCLISSHYCGFLVKYNHIVQLDSRVPGEEMVGL